MPSAWSRCCQSRRLGCGGPGAPPLLAGTGQTTTFHLLIVDRRPRPVRRLQLAIVKLARRDQAATLLAAGKTVKILAVGRKGATSCARARPDRRSIESGRSASRSASPMPSRSPGRSSTCSTPASSTSRRCSIRTLQVGDLAGPTEQQLIPGRCRGRRAAARSGGGSTPTSRTKIRNPADLLPRTSPVQIFRARCSRTPRAVLRRADERDGQRTRNAGDDDQAARSLQPQRQARSQERNDRDHRGARRSRARI